MYRMTSTKGFPISGFFWVVIRRPMLDPKEGCAVALILSTHRASSFGMLELMLVFYTLLQNTDERCGRLIFSRSYCLNSMSYRGYPELALFCNRSPSTPDMTVVNRLWHLSSPTEKKSYMFFITWASFECVFALGRLKDVNVVEGIGWANLALRSTPVYSSRPIYAHCQACAGTSLPMPTWRRTFRTHFAVLDTRYVRYIQF